jgi:hypothetical protein
MEILGAASLAVMVVVVFYYAVRNSVQPGKSTAKPLGKATARAAKSPPTTPTIEDPDSQRGQPNRAMYASHSFNYSGYSHHLLIEDGKITLFGPGIGKPTAC